MRAMLLAGCPARSKCSININGNLDNTGNLESFPSLSCSILPFIPDGIKGSPRIKGTKRSFHRVLLQSLLPPVTFEMKQLGGSERFFLLSSILFLI